MTLPEVAVIIPTYNRWPFVCDAIDAVLGQTYDRTRCCVVDDASADGSFEHIREKYGNRITLLRNPVNKEKSFSRNRPVREFDPDVVGFLDSDDILTEDSVEKRMEIFLSNPGFQGVSYGVNISMAARKKRKQARVGRPIFKKLAMDEYLAGKSGLHTNSFLIPRSAMLRFGMFNEALKIREDMELFIRLLSHIEFRYCGAVVSIKRNMGDRRARNNYEGIIAQGRRFSETLTSNRFVYEKIRRHMKKIRGDEYADILGALYHAKKYNNYRSFYIDGLRRDLTPKTFKFFRRFLVSTVNGLLEHKTKTERRT